MNIWLSFLIDSLAFGATFIYGSTGEILTEKAGHLNLGIPGIMCMGGAGGCLVLNWIGKSNLPPFLIVILGILGSLALAMLCGLIYSFLTVTLRANQNVTGLALTTFGVGLMKVIMSKMDATVYLIGPKMMYRWPFADRQDALQGMGILFFLALIIALAASWVLFRTRVGLSLRAVGENPGTADAVGINVTRYKYVATLIGSMIAGLGGLYYVMECAHGTWANEGFGDRGWLAIALVIFTTWRPSVSIFASILFGGLIILSEHLSLPLGIKELYKLAPYVVTLLVLIIVSLRKKRENQPPQSLGLAYFREER